MRNIYKYVLAYLLVVLITGIDSTKAQAPLTNKDSLLQQLAIAKEDSNKVKLLLDVGYVFERNSPDSADQYYQLAGALSDKLHYVVGKLKYISYHTAVLNMHDKYAESLVFNLQAIELAKSIHNDLQAAVAYGNAGASYYGLKDYTKCIDCFLEAEKILQKINDKRRLTLTYGNLTGLFNQLNQYDKAYAYGLKAIAASKEVNDDYSLEESLENTGNTLDYMKKSDSALLLLQQAAAMAKKLNDKLVFLNSSINIADIYFGRQDYNAMKKYAEEAIAAANEIGNKEGVGKAMNFIGYYYFYNKNYDSASTYANKGLSIARENNVPEAIENNYQLLGYISLANGNLKDFHRYKVLKDSIQDLIFSKQILSNTQDIEAKYSLEKKEAQIQNLHQEQQIQHLQLKQNRNTIVSLIIFILLLGGSGFLIFRNTQQKRKIQQQRITELEKEKQFMAAEAVLQGQEEERSRLAKDLHDGLGGILSGVKHSFNNMKSNFIISQESVDAFDRTMVLLDKSISELRNISHNMMPEALLRFGLDTALRDYCNSINRNASLQITYQSFELHDEDIEKSKASVIYRVIQELLNNMLKHANASTALVQLVRNNNALSITVEDNGKGFNKSEAENTEGIGMKNIKHRINYLNGQLDIQTAEGAGVSVTIEIPNIAA
ncbi:MAG: sensor histidine kinase [Chitinophagaceae bacterium]